MEKNYLHRVLWLVLIVIFALIAAYWLPDIKIKNVELKRVDILSDLVGEDEVVDQDSVDLLPTDSIILARKAEFVDSCRTGMTCIEDYSEDGRGMDPFYAALDSLSTLSRPIRIAVLGDSYIEGDIFTADLRKLLQERYGGCGVGFVPITSETYGFRRSVIHRFGGWRDHISTSPNHDYNRNNGIISGHYFYPDSSAWMSLAGQKRYYNLLDTCQRSTIYFMSNDSNTVTVSVNGGAVKRSFDVLPSESIQSLSVDGKIGRVRWTSKRLGRNFVFYGATMDCVSGIVVDNFSLRGSPGSNLEYVHEDMIRKFHQVRPYDLVIMMYGLNVATSSRTNYDGYKKAMGMAIESLKRNMPGTGFLLVSVGDREERVDGEFRTMRGVKNLVRYQQSIAADNGIAFWNLYEAMGGEGGIVKMVNAKPAEANLDYTHINFLGGRRLATIFFESLEYGKERRDRRLAYERGEEGL